MNAAKAHTRHSSASDLYQLIEKLTMESRIVHTTMMTFSIPRAARSCHAMAKEKPKEN